MTELDKEHWENRVQFTLRDVAIERANQLKKWGPQSHCMSVWNAILMEEVGELSEAILNAEFGKSIDMKAMREEAIQIAAVAVAIAQCIDYREA